MTNQQWKELRFLQKNLNKYAKIRILPDYIIDTIAAGEVIERLYSVIKELIENSIDAEAKNIDVYVENGGIDKILIVDDGKGIREEDLMLCVKRHATSKINENDLSKIETLGFRGRGIIRNSFRIKIRNY